MIDVYMLVNEGILSHDHNTRRINGVFFCECDDQIFPEMKELVGVEEAGFLAKLEELVLFQDIQETAALESEAAITEFLEAEGEGLAEGIRSAAEQKRSHLQFQRAFPFDFVNLDFCDRYYGAPPDVMKIHATVERVLEWQRRAGRLFAEDEFNVDRFVVAITCRFDHHIHSSATSRLKRIITTNKEEHPAYANALHERGIANIGAWASEDPLDFFMAAWPKEIARIAREKAWDIEVDRHVFYERKNDLGEPYKMLCLVLEFKRTSMCQTYLSAALRCLDSASRTEIPFYSDRSQDGQQLLRDLRRIVALRNSQAKKFAREALPDPAEELRRLRGEGIPI